ncbi:AcrR family transcriptional regulator [Streptomyces sp. SAI-149]|nr:AcrR family transcriptional regulator [Streptomyces sp. SAI-119]MDH6494118.1 AcrR family transcriptional regulator [Streptomyces sp. SAI-149]
MRGRGQQMEQPEQREPQQERSRVTQRKILDAAGQVLGETGWDGLVISKVAATAGVSVGSVYERFTDKGGLVRAVQHDVLDAVDKDLRGAFARLERAEQIPVADLIAVAVVALAEQLARHRTVMGPLILRAATDASLRERGNATSALAEELFTSLLVARAHELSCSDPATAVPVIFRTVFSTAMWQVMFGSETGLQHEISEERLLRELISMCQLYLLSPDGGRK